MKRAIDFLKGNENLTLETISKIESSLSLSLLGECIRFEEENLSV